VWILPSAPAGAKEPPAEFQRALRIAGYEDMAIAYLQQLAARDDLPAAERDTLPLELSTTYRVWSLRSNPEMAAQRRALAQQYFDDFSKQHPGHPAVARSWYEWGDALLEQAAGRLAILDDVKSPAAAREQFRQQLQEAELCFETARTEFQNQLPATPTNPESLVPPSEAELGTVQSMLKLARCRYALARTYASDKDAQRQKYLLEASSMLDTIARKYHAFEIGLEAQFWNAKVLQELGDDAAIDVYDEVLASEPQDTPVRPELAELFADATLSRLRLMRAGSDPLVVLKEADDWMRNHQPIQETDMFRGIALEAAQLELALSNTADERPALQAKTRTKAEATILAIAKTPGKYQQQAIRIRQQELANGRMKTPLSVPEHVALAELAMRNGEWTQAIEILTTAVTQAKSESDNESVATLTSQITLCRYQLAALHLQDKRWEEAIQEAGAAARLNPDDPYAPLASELAAKAAYNAFVAASDPAKLVALERLRKIAEFTTNSWPKLDAAANGQIILAEAYVSQEDYDRAIEVLDGMLQSETVIPAAAVAAGRVYYALYIKEKKKPEAEQNEDQLRTFRAKADTALAVASEHLPAPDLEPTSARMACEALLLRAELSLDNKDVDGAQACIGPLYAQISAGLPNLADPLVVRIAGTALRTRVMAQDFDGAAPITDFLIQLRADNPPINSALVQVGNALAQGVLSNKSQDNPEASGNNAAPATGDLQKQRDLLRRLLDYLSECTQLSPAQMTFVAEASVAMDLSQPAFETAQRFFERFEADPAFRAAADKTELRMRFVYARKLREFGRAEDAKRELDLFLSENPRRLDALLEQLRILEQLSAGDAKYCSEGIACGTKLRKLLSGLNPRPPEYYDVILRTARCLLLQSAAERSIEPLGQAEKILKSTLALSPELNGPETRQQFQLLLDRIEAEKKKLR
jgi:tetratricopeptide (TPR) repeat protein